MPYDPVPQSDRQPRSNQTNNNNNHNHINDHNNSRLPSPPQFNQPNHLLPQQQHQRRFSTGASNETSSIEPSSNSEYFDSAEDDLITHHYLNSHPSPTTLLPNSINNHPSSSSSNNNHHSLHRQLSPSSQSPSSTLSSSSPTLLQSNSTSPHQPQFSKHSASNRPRDSYANTYGSPASAAGPDLSSLSAIASGLVGGDYGPFPQELSHPGIGPYTSSNPRRLSANDPIVDFALLPPGANGYSGSVRDSLVSYDDSGAGHVYGTMSLPPPIGLNYTGTFSETTEDLLWKEENKEPDDFLHDPDPDFDSRADRKFILWSRRGWMNVASLSILVSGLIGLFALYPILTYVLRRGPTALGWNLGGINGTGQFPDIPNLPRLIDLATPDDAKHRTGLDGKKYNLVFSDEFNTDNRTFWPGDDPFWEAVDLHYWQTTNFEWYDPDAVTTKGGSLVIQIDQEPAHNLRARSGMIQSWNKFCFTEGYIEVNISLPGSPGVQGFWPGAWTMGNLARAGFGASNEGMWPYSYEACDVGTLPNQTMPDGRTPPAAKTSGSPDYGGALSWLPGQRTSACTCKGEDHPGPSVDVGRSGPEIDILEAQYAYGPNGNQGSMSQSIQIAPMDEGYQWLNDSSSMHVTNLANSPKDPSGTIINRWHGSIWQESLSGITMTDGTSYEGKGFQQFGFEYNKGFQGDGGRVSWTYGGKETWTIYANAIAGQSGTQVSPRPISTEPMYVILNLGISNKFQTVEWEKLNFPAKMYIDYVRIYQREGHTNIGCSPKDRPTEDYINRHLGAYTNPNFTTWAQAGYTVPKNRLKDSC
ncbi:hypothetical protein PGT21_003086 [Puccinia graminis f. sp. tritici]|uniref:GH16 domain-containing protein n=1 Tax=Puccinia graminis f. sp. tritici TaxID=56615 RepID=A0A5B0M527_PUCGR|nr:hypothetical protein PGTUg99_001433 [Puccinia graminis f. sp. tritici]KAA1099311.1 hypothetical protein PGT21_003086 [Puccinia graminis f. sp. tritici]